MSILYQAFGWVLLQIYNLVQNYGIAIIIFTLLVKLLLLPLNLKQTRSMKETQAIQPELQKIQKKYKNNPDKLNQETMKLYKLYNVNPMAGCLPLILQLPIIYGLFGALRNPDQWVTAGVSKAGFLWLPSLSTPDPYYIIPILCVVLTFITQKFTMKFQDNGDSAAQQTTKMMIYIMPLFIGFAALSMPAGVGLYWVIQSLFTFVQQYFSMRKPLDVVSPEEAERALEEAKKKEQKEKKEKRQQQTEMRQRQMEEQAGQKPKEPKEKKERNKPRTKPASKKVVRKTITKIPERKDDK